MGFFRVAGVPKRATHGVDTIDDEAAVRDLPRLVLQQLLHSEIEPERVDARPEEYPALSRGGTRYASSSGCNRRTCNGADE
jgi:hypothetical protein